MAMLNNQMVNLWLEWANAVNLDTAHVWEISGTTLDLSFGKFGPDDLLSGIAENHNYFTKQKSWSVRLHKFLMLHGAGIFTNIWAIVEVNVGKYSSPAPWSIWAWFPKSEPTPPMTTLARRCEYRAWVANR